MTRRAYSPPIRALRAAAVGAVLLAGIASLSGASAQNATGFNSNSPVNFAADRIELQDKANRVVLSGNVDITQDDLRLRAARTTVAYANGGGLKIQRIDATGGVTVTRGDQVARGNVGIYDVGSRVITLVGNVSLRRGTDNLNGGRLVYNLSTGLASVDGAPGGRSGGRVTGTFAVPKQQN